MLAFGGTAYAGEVNGTGGSTQGPAHANSICVFSGLADGGEGEPAGPGNPPQNWGQISQEDREFLTSIGEYPGRACNGHLNPLKGGG
jgi:hypothetical protein